MKPEQYQNQTSIYEKHHLAMEIAEYTGTNLVTLPSSYEITYALVNIRTHETVAWLESSCPGKKTPGEFSMALSAYEGGLSLCRKTLKPFIMAYQWKQCRYIYQINKNLIPLVLVVKQHESNNQLSPSTNNNHKYFVRIPDRLFTAF